MPSKPVVTRAKAYLKVRHKNVRTALKKLELGAMMLTHAPDVSYLTNFTGDESVGVITDKDFHLVSDFRFKEQIEQEAGWVKLSLRTGNMADELGRVLKELKVRRVGFEANFTTVGQIDALGRVLKDLKATVELVPLENVMANLRKVKDDTEIDLIRKSVGIAEEAFNAIRAEVKPGQTENYLAGLLGFELRSRGASGSSFPVIVAAGANSSLPHYHPGEVLVQKDQPVLIDWGAVLKGYCSDLTRTLLVGRVSDRMKEIYKVVLEAQQAAIEFLRPGVTGKQADRVARDIIEKAGYGPQFGHGLGHGLGREVHELPTLRKTGQEEELRPGMVVTVEPGIYLPAEGGVRIEDDVLITHSGREVLSSLPKTFEECHVE